LLLTIANSAQFGNGARIAPQARIDDGLLDLVVFEERSRVATLAALPRLFFGGVEKVRGVTMKRIERVAIDSARPMMCHADGEPFEGGTHVTASVRPHSLRVAVR
jgi:diacylglycerol kinase family enzyme